MFRFVVLTCLVAVALSAISPNEPVPILAQSSEVNPDGSYQYSYQSADGTSQDQSGQLVGDGESVRGSVSYTDNEGGQHQLSYTADENGYQPQSADLPVGPEIPLAILKGLEWNAAHPEEEKEA